MIDYRLDRRDRLPDEVVISVPVLVAAEVGVHRIPVPG
jgi:hypothetical protein